jgi:teichuronic acid biosynthesis glycosyltransferase TuaG
VISIIVPLYNYKQYIRENIESIRSQSMTDWEIVIVDDASTDDPIKAIKPYLSEKIKYVRLDQNVGYGAAKNVGIRNSKGEYIVVLDADDMLTPKSLDVRYNLLKEREKLWIHGRAYEFSGAKPYHFRFKKRKSIKRLEKILKTKNYSDLWENIHAQTVMVKREVYEKVGLYEPRLRSMGDKEMWARIINNIGVPLYTREFVAYYRQHSGQMHRSAEKKKNVNRYIRILNKFMKRRRKGNFCGVEKL